MGETAEVGPNIRLGPPERFRGHGNAAVCREFRDFRGDTLHPSILEVLDEIGLGVHLRRAEALSGQLGDPHFAPPPLLARMVDAGELGVASGRGFRTTQEPS